MNMIKSFAGSALAVLISGVCASTVQANDEVFWIGPSGGLWSVDSNWFPHAPNSDTANFNIKSNAVNVVDLDVTKTVQDLYVAYQTSLVITNSSDETYTLTTGDSWMTTEENSTIEVAGPHTAVNIVAKKAKNVKGCNNYVKGTHIASGGAALKMNRADPDDNEGQKFIARGSGSMLEFALVRWENTTNSVNKNNIEYIAEDGGKVTSKGNWRGANGDAPKYIARNGGVLELANISTTSSYKIKPTVVCDAATVKVGAFYQGVSGGVVAITNGTFSVNGALSLSDGNYYTDVTLAGDNPIIQGTASASFTFGSTKAGNANRLTFKLAPTLNWSETSGRVRLTTNESAALIALRDTVKFEIDCSAFKEWYGTKTVMLMQQAYGSEASYSIPVASKVTLTGEGAENCTVSFSQSGQNLMMTIDSKNVAKGSVARVGSRGYPTLQAAVNAAQSDDTVYVVDNVSLTDEVVIGKSLTFELGAHTVACHEAGFASTNLFRVTGGTLTIKGAGAINGGTNAAVCVTGGSFSSPTASTVTFSSKNDTVVLSAGVTADILDGTFMSENGQPVNSSSNGILRGGLYNKEPAFALIADGYTTEKVGELWEVVLAGDPICEVNGRKFASLEKAYAVVPNNGDIFMIADAKVPPLTLNRDIAFTLALKGFTLTPETEGTLFTVEAGTVDFFDFGEPMGALKGGVVVKGGAVNIIAVIDADPALSVDGGTVYVPKSTFNGTVTLNGGTLTMNATVNADGVAIAANGGTLNVAGGNYTGGTSAFAAGENFSSQCIFGGSFSSALDTKYLAGNRLQKQVGDRYEVVLASDENPITYTWKGGASGDWANPDNWTPSLTPCFGIPSNSKATAKFASASADVVVNLGGGNYPIGAFKYSHGYRQTLTNGAVKLSSGCLSGDRRLILKDINATVDDPVFANNYDFNFQLSGNVKVIGDVSPNKSSTWQQNALVAYGSNEVTGVVHNRSAKFNVYVAPGASLVVGEIKADSNTGSSPLSLEIDKGATMKVGKIVAADVAGKFAFTFNATADGFASAPVSFVQNTGNVALDDKTAITVNIDEGFASGAIPLFSGVGLSAESQPEVTVNIAGKTAEDISRMKIRLRERNGVICLDIRPQALVITIQ